MKFFVVLLAVGLSASEKLNHVYLPPPGAKLAEGRSEDLQTPLEYPEETPIFGLENSATSSVGSEIEKSEFQSGVFKTVNFDVKTGDKEMLIDTPLHLNSGFEMDVIPVGLELESTVENGSPNSRYPLNGEGISTEKEGIFYHWNSRDNFEKPGNMPIITIPTGIMQNNNYESNAFGMYGGNPMIIQSYSETSQNLQPVNIFKDYSKNHLNHTSDDISIPNEMFRSNSEKSIMYGATRTLSTPNLRILPEITQYIAVTTRPDKQEAQKYLQEKPESPQASEKTAIILNYENVLSPEGFFNSFDTSNGIHIDESATTLDGVKAQGSYSFTSDDGKVYSITYTADENGFQPNGDHLPTPPPIPEAIQKVIDQANKDKEAGIFHDGSYDEKRYGYLKYQGPVNRYLHNKQESLETENRKRVLRPTKIKKTFPTKDLIKDTASKNEKNFQQSDLNGQYGMKREQFVQRNEANIINSQNGENSSRLRIPIIKADNIKPSVANFYIKAKNTTDSKDEPLQGISSNGNKGFYNNQITGNLNSMTKYQVTTKSSFDSNKRLEMTVTESGYFYVPPRNKFIQRKLQNKPSLEGISGQNGNLEIKSVPVTGFYYIAQNQNIDQFPEKHSAKMTSYFTTKEHLNLQTKESDFYESTNHELEQSIADKKTTTVITTENIVTANTGRPYENSLGTNLSNKAYEAIENRVNNSFPSTRNNLSTANYLSTTPMPSQYKSQQLGDPNQYNTTYPSIGIENTSPNSGTNYVANEGYFQTIPAIPETFEDIPTSTYKPIYTLDEFQTEQTINIKVDGFGRPIQDTSSFNTNANGYYSNSLFGDEYIMRSSTPYSNEYEKDFKSDTATTIEDSKSTSSEILSKDFDIEEEGATHTYFGNKLVTSLIDKPMENDFSGPKQSQSYDPEKGYFY